jgi:hypothetical protein
MEPKQDAPYKSQLKPLLSLCLSCRAAKMREALAAKREVEKKKKLEDPPTPKPNKRRKKNKTIRVTYDAIVQF